MPLFIAAILGGLIEVAGTLVGKVLISLGIGYVAYQGVDTGITYFRDQLVANIGALPAIAVGVASTCKIGVCISILTSALLGRMTLAGLQGGTLRKMVNKG